MLKNTISRSISGVEAPLKGASDGCETELTKLPKAGADGGGVSHCHPCLHCRAFAVCPLAYGERCPLPPLQTADCRDDVHAEKERDGL